MKLTKLSTLVIIAATSFTFNAMAAETQPVATAISATQAVQTLNQYEKIMVGPVWITTGALNQKGETVANTDQGVSNYFGVAEYFADHTFKMLSPDGKPKMQGDWSMSEDGKTRTLVAKDASGNILFTRTVENVKVTPEEYTYRIYPNADSKTEYFDIVHKPQ
ncbi:DUF4822 domain-containing protein [Zophobihabitans entericus]|uniref:DUF4822 domain-containing protein n=1 Tax=Zophobihabitans entericus TaxID=1635327 RepID=A0A6G9IC73_9GAMM|nr:DUF4822 domain-containing protein [Zophobihabitans entericus]QIQ21813.1 DUF4822 domain-containing protein [Zophobihabitans entericus]